MAHIFRGVCRAGQHNQRERTLTMRDNKRKSKAETLRRKQARRVKYQTHVSSEFAEVLG